MKTTYEHTLESRELDDLVDSIIGDEWPRVGLYPEIQTEDGLAVFASSAVRLCVRSLGLFAEVDPRAVPEADVRQSVRHEGGLLEIRCLANAAEVEGQIVAALIARLRQARADALQQVLDDVAPYLDAERREEIHGQMVGSSAAEYLSRWLRAYGPDEIVREVERISVASACAIRALWESID